MYGFYSKRSHLKLGLVFAVLCEEKWKAKTDTHTHTRMCQSSMDRERHKKLRWYTVFDAIYKQADTLTVRGHIGVH